MMNTLNSLPLIEPKIDDSAAKQGRWMVVIYNNDTCSMDEVVEILMAATGCDIQEAYIEMWEAHTFGKAPVHFSSKSECDEAGRIISSIGVQIDVCPEWKD